jgi:hypothetical protein
MTIDEAGTGTRLFVLKHITFIQFNGLNEGSTQSLLHHRGGK